MLDKLTDRLDFHGKALALRAERQRTIASNIANADTPGYVGRDFLFSEALKDATGQGSSLSLPLSAPSPALSLPPAGLGSTHAGHIPLTANTATGLRQGYTVASQPSMDNNTVDLDRERANFADNSVRYEATLRFINGNSKTMLSAITGQ